MFCEMNSDVYSSTPTRGSEAILEAQDLAGQQKREACRYYFSTTEVLWRLNLHNNHRTSTDAPGTSRENRLSGRTSKLRKSNHRHISNVSYSEPLLYSIMSPPNLFQRQESSHQSEICPSSICNASCSDSWKPFIPITGVVSLT